jgi:hypothetical protein
MRLTMHPRRFVGFSFTEVRDLDHRRRSSSRSRAMTDSEKIFTLKAKESDE